MGWQYLVEQAFLAEVVIIKIEGFFRRTFLVYCISVHQVFMWLFPESIILHLSWWYQIRQMLQRVNGARLQSCELLLRINGMTVCFYLYISTIISKYMIQSYWFLWVKNQLPKFLYLTLRFIAYRAHIFHKKFCTYCVRIAYSVICNS